MNKFLVMRCKNSLYRFSNMNIVDVNKNDIRVLNSRVNWEFLFSDSTIEEIIFRILNLLKKIIDDEKN